MLAQTQNLRRNSGKYLGKDNIKEEVLKGKATSLEEDILAERLNGLKKNLKI